MVETSWAIISRKLPTIQKARIFPVILGTLGQRLRLKSDRDHFLTWRFYSFYIIFNLLWVNNRRMLWSFCSRYVLRHKVYEDLLVIIWNYTFAQLWNCLQWNYYLPKSRCVCLDIFSEKLPVIWFS